MIVVSISGPYRGKTPWDVEQNVRQAETLALEVAKMGAMPLCVHSMTRFWDRQLTDEFWLQGIMDLTLRADAVLFTTDWKRSTVALKEFEAARSCGLPMFYAKDLAPLKEWIARLNSPSCIFESCYYHKVVWPGTAGVNPLPYVTLCELTGRITDKISKSGVSVTHSVFSKETALKRIFDCETIPLDSGKLLGFTNIPYPEKVVVGRSVINLVLDKHGDPLEETHPMAVIGLKTENKKETP